MQDVLKIQNLTVRYRHMSRPAVDGVN
ncbi:hypothetical protein EVA_07494, partial [gut metagenome]